MIAKNKRLTRDYLLPRLDMIEFLHTCAIKNLNEINKMILDLRKQIDESKENGELTK